MKKDKGIKSELFRKTLHMLCVGLVLLPIYLISKWYFAALSVMAAIPVIYPLLTLAERHPQYGAFFSQRKEGEVKRSFLLVSLMILVLIVVFWGCLGEQWKYNIVVAVLAWGFGDAAAAIIGKACGRHFLQHPLIEGKKTVEGTVAMFAVSCMAIGAVTILYAVLPWYLCLVLALLVSPFCALVELFSKGGSDTITVPLSTALLVYVVVSCFTYFGGAA